MPPKQRAGRAKTGASSKSATGPSDQERKQEASKTAQAALEAQREAQKLTKAAAGAGDPEERQRLLNEALQKEMEAGSLGKTAKYLTSGSFQGLVAGTGIGTGVGAGLGTLTGTLVGGVTSLVTGGVGAGVGALHGPFIQMGEVAGEGVRSVTGTIPGWEATEEQRKTLEKMVGQINDQDRPSEHDLTAMSDPSKVQVSSSAENQKEGHDNGETGEGRSWGDYASSYLPSKESLPSKASLPSLTGSSTRVTRQSTADRKRRDREGSRSTSEIPEKESNKLRSVHGKQPPNAPNTVRTANSAGNQAGNTRTKQEANPRRPRKLERRTDPDSDAQMQKPAKKKPRKLEIRSKD